MIRRRALGGLWGALLGAALLAAPGCAARWTPRAMKPPTALQWPDAPARAKLTLVESLSGFSQARSAGSALGGVVVGRSKQDTDAFVLPVSVATGSDGRIAVGDLGRRCVHLYLPTERRYLRLTGSRQEPLLAPVGLAFGEAGRLHVADSAGRVFTFGPDGTVLSVWRSAGSEPFRRPTALAYSPERRLLYVVDALASRVHALQPDGEPAFSFGRRGAEPGDFNFPTHIFRTAAGELYISDALNFRVQIFDEQGGFRGAFGQHGDASGELALPKGLAVDRDGVVYVVDSLFDNVQLFDRQGTFLLTLGRRGAALGEFWLPGGAFVGATDLLYVCDTYNRRVQVFRITEQYGDGIS
jgi:DNA-binding beta-propeller fold protein YncE